MCGEDGLEVVCVSYEWGEDGLEVVCVGYEWGEDGLEVVCVGYEWGEDGLEVVCVGYEWGEDGLEVCGGGVYVWVEGEDGGSGGKYADENQLLLTTNYRINLYINGKKKKNLLFWDKGLATPQRLSTKLFLKADPMSAGSSLLMPYLDPSDFLDSNRFCVEPSSPSWNTTTSFCKLQKSQYLNISSFTR
ncbi:hypothetical protein HNY73_015286 [Argiope bruennichi]|uniref:Uncharacterized protein n=1 Tax=Argiope bruennichi TaxID=94029 RepID=A0A8T0ERW5_ARGBR|nr:hypothetical protein HNY73_015286 [Argiope bruennichi]